MLVVHKKTENMKCIQIAVLVLLLPLLTACPFDLDYQLEDQNVHKIDENLLGTWRCLDPDETVLKVSFYKKSDYLYAVSVINNSEMFTPETKEFTGWIARVNEQRFLVFSENEVPNKYYHYILMESSQNQLVVADLGLLVGGIDAVKSTASLREEVAKSMKLPEFYQSPIKYGRQN